MSSPFASRTREPLGFLPFSHAATRGQCGTAYDNAIVPLQYFFYRLAFRMTSTVLENFLKNVYLLLCFKSFGNNENFVEETNISLSH